MKNRTPAARAAVLEEPSDLDLTDMAAGVVAAGVTTAGVTVLAACRVFVVTFMAPLRTRWTAGPQHAESGGSRTRSMGAVTALLPP
jgi:hypothetical protein